MNPKQHFRKWFYQDLFTMLSTRATSFKLLPESKRTQMVEDAFMEGCRYTYQELLQYLKEQPVYKPLIHNIENYFASYSDN